MLRPLRPAPTAPRTIQQTPQFPTYALRAQQKDGVARDYGRPSPCLSGAPPNREQIFLSHFPAPGERTAKHASLTDQAPAPPEVHQATNNRFSPFPPRISVRSLTGRPAGLPLSISPPCFGLRQSALQPFSCHEQNDLSRNPVQHQDGCRRRLSIRQTRRPKPARSFWCLFLKKARLFVTETLVPAPRTLRRARHALAFPCPALRAITMPAEAYTFLRPRAMQRAELSARAGYAIPLFLIIEHEHARRAERLPCDRALALLQPVDRPAG